MDGQISMFDLTMPEVSIGKPIRLIELFAGIGSQALALEYIGADFEHWRISEWDVYANRSYKALHMPEDGTDYSRGMDFGGVVHALDKMGISTDGKTRLETGKIRGRGEAWCRKVYNEFRATHNIGSVSDCHGTDLGITEKYKYCYILTYSFPCQDLSVAGKGKGMKKGGGTRSGLLWEVERLLGETRELPDVLVMENVPQVHGQKNMPDFQKWMGFLSGKGYSNYWKDLNASDYGVAQNRVRCFMVSVLGEYNYRFPDTIPLGHCMDDCLEETVDESYYINTQSAEKLILDMLKREKPVQGGCDLTTLNPETSTVANCITTKDRGISGRKKEGNGVLECIKG